MTAMLIRTRPVDAFPNHGAATIGCRATRHGSVGKGEGDFEGVATASGTLASTVALASDLVCACVRAAWAWGARAVHVLPQCVSVWHTRNSRHVTPPWCHAGAS